LGGKNSRKEKKEGGRRRGFQKFSGKEKKTETKSAYRGRWRQVEWRTTI